MSVLAGAANYERLKICPGPHDFRRQSNMRFNMPPTYVCVRCGGTARPANVGSYLSGIRAGKRLAECERDGGSGASDARPLAEGSLP